jgi:hypothetical protein
MLPTQRYLTHVCKRTAMYVNAHKCRHTGTHAHQTHTTRTPREDTCLKQLVPSNRGTFVGVMESESDFSALGSLHVQEEGFVLFQHLICFAHKWAKLSCQQVYTAHCKPGLEYNGHFSCLSIYQARLVSLTSTLNTIQSSLLSEACTHPQLSTNRLPNTTNCCCHV